MALTVHDSNLSGEHVALTIFADVRFSAANLRMMTSSNGNIFRVTGPLCGEFTGPGEFPTQRPVTRSFDVSLICVWINGWVNNREAGDLRRYRGHYDRSRWIPHTKASDAELWCFFDLRLNKRLSKQPWGWWFETLSWSLWRHCNGTQNSWPGVMGGKFLGFFIQRQCHFQVLQLYFKKMWCVQLLKWLWYDTSNLSVVLNQHHISSKIELTKQSIYIIWWLLNTSKGIVWYTDVPCHV